MTFALICKDGYDGSTLAFANFEHLFDYPHKFALSGDGEKPYQFETLEELNAAFLKWREQFPSVTQDTYTDWKLIETTTTDYKFD